MLYIIYIYNCAIKMRFSKNSCQICTANNIIYCAAKADDILKGLFLCAEL